MISEKMKAMVSGSSVIRAMFEEGKKLAVIHGEENVFDFSIGNPNLEPPNVVKEAVIEILNSERPNDVHGYMNNSGYEFVREAIAKDQSKKNEVVLEAKDVTMTVGAAGALNIIMKTLLNPGDEVLVFAPFFSEYKAYASNYDANIVVVEPNRETFYPNLEQLKERITERTKIVIINNPNNPTGVIYSQECIDELCNILRAKQEEFRSEIYLVSDEPYRELIYDGCKVPLILKSYDNSIVAYSYSKSLSLPGERIGYVLTSPNIVDKELIASGLNVATRILGFVNAPSLFQRVIAKTLDQEVNTEFYKENRDMLYNHLTSLGFDCIKPQGAFYLFVKSPIENELEFCNVAKEFNILLVPGSAFNCSGYFRISYCVSHEKVRNSLQQFTKLAGRYF
ncbi:MAG: pyridoxal phosphate-dependent aminotransferase [Filifactoraceae bacterium]